MLSQFALPLCTEVLAVKLAAVGPVTAMVWGAGAAPLTVPLKVSELGLMVRGATTKVTGTVVVVNVSVNPAGLAAGTYNGSVAIAASGAGNSPQTVAVTLTVTTAPPPSGGGLTVTPTAMSFSATVGGADPATQTLSVTAASSTGFRASASGTNGGLTWLRISPSGRQTTNQNLTVTVTAAGLAIGTYTGSISLRVSSGEESYTR